MMSRDIYTTGTPNQPSNHRIFTVDFFGSSIKTIVTSNVSIIRKWIHATLVFNRRVRSRHPLIVGLGVQWDPDCDDDGTAADTLQLCVGNRCLIIQLSRATSVPRVLRRFLADESNRFVGIRNYMDAGRLSSSEHHLYVSRILNLALYTGGNHLNSSMETIASDVLDFDGVTKDPEIGRSDWGKNLLNKEQVEYACVDAHVSYKVGMALEAWKY